MNWIFLLLFGGLGLAALVGGLVWGANRYALVRGGVHAEGKVIDNYKSVSTTGETRRRETSESYYPVVEFSAADGAKARFHGSTGSSVPDYEVGATVDVIYNPAHPDEAQISSFSQLWLGPVVIGAAGLIFFLMGLGAFFLTGASDGALDAAEKSMARQMLVLKPNSVHISGAIHRVERLEGKNAGKFVFVCRAVATGADLREFQSEFFNFDPGEELAGKAVEIYLDPYDETNYYVNLDPLLPQIVKHQHH